MHPELLISLAAAITAGSTAGLTYTYFTDAAGTITLATPTAVGAGTYYIVGTTAAGCASAPIPVTVTVNPAPTVITNAPGAVCSPATVDLTAAAITAGSTAGLTYTYFTDAAGTITLATPTAVGAGTYYIVGTTAAGCASAPIAVTVTVNPTPTVVTNAPAAVCSPSTVNLTAATVTAGSTTGLTFTYFTDAAGTITLATPTTVGAGTYYIVGTTAAGCASAPIPVTVTVNATPTVITNAPGAVCAPGTVDLTTGTITAGSTAGLTYTYFTDAAGTTTLATPTAVGAGTYYIVGTTAAGCASAPIPVTVTVNPAPTVVTNAPAAVCAPATVDLTAAAVTAGSTAGLTFTYFTDAAGTITLATPNTIATGGTYYIKGTTAAGCSDIQPVLITINPLPSLIITNPAPVCSPSTVDITTAAVTAGSAPGLAYTYFTDAAGTITLATPNAVGTGIYYIKGTAPSGCSNIQPVVVAVNPKPSVSITNPGPVCAPTAIDLTLAAVTAGSTAGLTYTYFKDAAATIILTGPNAVTASGTYYIKGTTAAGCSDIKPVVVTVNPQPNATINYTANPYCATGTATVTQAGQTGGFYSAPAAVSINGATGAVNLAASTPGTYTVTYTFTNGTCSNSTTTLISINPKPTVSTHNPAAVCAPIPVNLTLAAVTAGSTPGLTFTYYKNAAATIILTNPNAVTVSGTYYIKGTNASGCTDIQPVVVTINPLPVATIAYTGSPYCTNGTAIVSLTGIGGGTFVSSAGLSLNPVTGDINLATSTEGIYVLYFFTNGT